MRNAVVHFQRFVRAVQCGRHGIICGRQSLGSTSAQAAEL
jgi:hypothetical protein